MEDMDINKIKKEMRLINLEKVLGGIMLGAGLGIIFSNHYEGIEYTNSMCLGGGIGIVGAGILGSAQTFYNHLERYIENFLTEDKKSS